MNTDDTELWLASAFSNLRDMRMYQLQDARQQLKNWQLHPKQKNAIVVNEVARWKSRIGALELALQNIR